MSEKILVVEDNHAVRDSLEDLLKMEHFQVDTVPTGEKALKAIKDEPYSLVLLDLKLPGISGTEVMRQSRRFSPDTKTIILTGHGSLESAIIALRTGARDYILKPFEPHELLNSIRQSLSETEKKQQVELLIEHMESSLERYKDIEGLTTPDTPPHRVVILPQGISLDLERREMWRGGVRTHLTPTEGKLLSVFLENKEQVLSHKDLVSLWFTAMKSHRKRLHRSYAP